MLAEDKLPIDFQTVRELGAFANPSLNETPTSTSNSGSVVHEDTMTFSATNDIYNFPGFGPHSNASMELSYDYPNMAETANLMSSQISSEPKPIKMDLSEAKPTAKMEFSEQKQVPTDSRTTRFTIDGSRSRNTSCSQDRVVKRERKESFRTRKTRSSAGK